MPNGRALPTALLFDELLARAWGMGLQNYAKANALAEPSIGAIKPADGNFGVPGFSSSFSGGVSGVVAAHDRELDAQLREVLDAWAAEFADVMQLVAPVGPGFHLAVQWLRDVVSGADGLGYVGQDHRNAQAQHHAAVAAASINPRGLPMPEGAAEALRAVTIGITGLYAGRASAQMDADRISEQRKLLIDAVETLTQLRNAALDAAMDMIFTEMNLMFDVFGPNNNYLTRARRSEKAMEARMQVRSAELQSWDARVLQNFDGNTDALRKVRLVNDRALEKAGMTVEQHIKRLRRFSSRAAAALNSTGVSVNSNATESNQVDAEQA